MSIIRVDPAFERRAENHHSPTYLEIHPESSSRSRDHRKTKARRCPSVGAALAIGLLTASACSSSEAPDAAQASLYALVEGIDGVYFYPPLGPEPSPAGRFDASLLDGLSVVLEADASGTVSTLATFDARTLPAVALLAERERYFVNIPAATYLTDPAKTYRVRVLLDGSELGISVLSPRVFEVMAYVPHLPIGVHVRVEGSGAVRAIPRARAGGGSLAPHCSDGVRNKDETDVDCGGSCPSCELSLYGSPLHCSNGYPDADETGHDCGGSCGLCAPYGGPAHCTNGAWDAGETGTDCGGDSCAPCGPDGAPALCGGAPCGPGGFAIHCTDGVRDADEAGLDCGGSCAPCACVPATIPFERARTCDGWHESAHFRFTSDPSCIRRPVWSLITMLARRTCNAQCPRYQISAYAEAEEWIELPMDRGATYFPAPGTEIWIACSCACVLPDYMNGYGG